MALIKCHECSGTVSTTATTCPHCGAPQPNGAQAPSAPPPVPARAASPNPLAAAQPAPPKSRWPVWVAALIGFIVLVNWIGSAPTTKPPAPKVAPAPKAPPPLEPLAAEFEKQVAAKNWIEARARLAMLKKHYPTAEATKAALAQQPAIEKGATEQLAKQNAAAEAKRNNAYASLRKNRDDIQKLTFYHAPEVPMNGVANYWGLYIVQPDKGQPYVRFKFMYTADDWLFVESMTVQIDGQTLPTAALGHFDVERDNSGGRIWEWKDESVDAKLLPFFDRVAASKRTVLRLNGRQYYKDRTITDAEKRGIRNVLKAYRERLGLPSST